MKKKSVDAAFYSKVITITQVFFLGPTLVFQYVEVLLSTSHFTPKNNHTEY